MRNLFKRKNNQHMRYLSQAVQLEEAVNPNIIRGTILTVTCVVIVFITWSAMTRINEVARTAGEIIPLGNQQSIQHLEGGIVEKIHVEEGQIVKKGDVLITLNTDALVEDYDRAKIKQLGWRMEIERHRAFINNRDPNFKKFKNAPSEMVSDQIAFFETMNKARSSERKILFAQIQNKKRTVEALKAEKNIIQKDRDIAKNVYNRRILLSQQGYASEMQILNDERQINQINGNIERIDGQLTNAHAEINEFVNRLNSLDAQHRDTAMERIANLSSQIAENQQIIEKLDERQNRTMIKSPANGLVKGLAINTVGSIIKPAATMMQVVPIDRALVVETKIQPKDVGHLKIGQDVRVKLSSYDFSRYGYISGKLDYISPTTFIDNNDSRHYRGRVLLDKSYVGNNVSNKIIPGMTVMADIVTGNKTVLQYMLKPIHLSLKTSLTER